MKLKELEKGVKMLNLEQIELNEGQLQGFPKNPRNITPYKYDKLKSNIQNYPEMLQWRSLIVYPLDDNKYIIIGGNMRYRALQELGYNEAPAFILPKETPIEKLQAYTILDNNNFGEWDWDLLANEWPSDLIEDWGIDTWDLADNLQNQDTEKEKGDDVTKQRLLLQFNGHKIQMTEAEMEGLDSILEEYMDNTGGHFGFVNYIIEKFSENEDN